MKVSVTIPAYNCAATIRATLDSVLRQTSAPDEILVMNDGSTDETLAILESYKDRIKVFSQPNRGVASARSALVALATGDLIAFLDSDDLWHPKYLEVQRDLSQAYPKAVAFFTGHLNFHGYGDCEWDDQAVQTNHEPELMRPPRFLERYHRYPNCFASPSFCCVPKSVLREIGEIDGAPFCAEVSGADDFYLLHMLPLLGPVAYDPSPLAAYRVTYGGLSAQRLKLTARAVRAMELVEHRYRGRPTDELSGVFSLFFASKRREYARVLMGAGETHDARKQLRRSLRNASNPSSFAKSLVWLFLTYVPGPLQPTWPMPYYQSRESAH